MILYTDATDVTDLHGKSLEKSALFRVHLCNPCPNRNTEGIHPCKGLF